MKDELINYCMFCNTEQQLTGETDFYCERCGAKNSTDGSCEVPNQEESERQQDFYDNNNEGAILR